MNAVDVFMLLTYAFGSYVFGAVSYYAVRDVGWRSWTTHEIQPSPHSRLAELASYALIFYSFVWFVVLLSWKLLDMIPVFDSDIVQLSFLTMALGFPPLIMIVTYLDVNREAKRTSRLWLIVPALVAPINLFCVVAIISVVLGRPITSVRWANTWPDVILGITFGITAVFAGLILSFASNKQETAKEIRGRKNMRLLYGFMFLLVIAIFAGAFLGLSTELLSTWIGTSMPLIFIFVGIYNDNRFEFFDLFIKRGLSLMLTLLLLGLWAMVVWPIAVNATDGWQPWAFAMLFLPLGIALPWIHRKLGEVLDNVWLGRRFNVVEAVKHFLGGLQDSTSEATLAERAERGLSEIFQARTRVQLDTLPIEAPDFEPIESAEILLEGERRGEILLGRRDNDAPYFNQDKLLLRALTDVLANMLQNVRLQHRKQEEEQRSKDLSLRASESELKALRAQINPHFLFNALNAIAGLIHQDPERADETVEQLAEVFRYTLRGSQSEWARLEDEIEFVEAYLNVEQARFGERLQVQLEVAPDARSIQIPTMMIQTLVENGVKHGIAQVRGGALLGVKAFTRDEQLIVEVRDSGPGPDQSSDRPRPKGAGYGLRNIRERLAGHFAAEAQLELSRDDNAQQTIARITMPSAPRADRGSSSEVTP